MKAGVENYELVCDIRHFSRSRIKAIIDSLFDRERLKAL